METGIAEMCSDGGNDDAITPATEAVAVAATSPGKRVLRDCIAVAIHRDAEFAPVAGGISPTGPPVMMRLGVLMQARKASDVRPPRLTAHRTRSAGTTR